MQNASSYQVDSTMQAENKTLYQYGIKDEAERSILILWSLVVFLASLIGDSRILIGTIEYHAIKQHKVIVAVIQHMAVFDLLQSVLKVFPTTIALITDHWVFGDFMIICNVQVHITDYVLPHLTLFLTNAMSTLKLIILKWPLRTAAWSSRLGHKICGALWIAVLCLYTPTIVANLLCIGDTIGFNYSPYTCDYTPYPVCPHGKRCIVRSYYTISFPSSPHHKEGNIT